jgi:hypothetical protein
MWGQKWPLCPPIFSDTTLVSLLNSYYWTGLIFPYTHTHTHTHTHTYTHTHTHTHTSESLLICHVPLEGPYSQLPRPSMMNESPSCCPGLKADWEAAHCILFVSWMFLHISPLWIRLLAPWGRNQVLSISSSPGTQWVSNNIHWMNAWYVWFEIPLSFWWWRQIWSSWI